MLSDQGKATGGGDGRFGWSICPLRNGQWRHAAWGSHSQRVGIADTRDAAERCALATFGSYSAEAPALGNKHEPQEGR